MTNLFNMHISIRYLFFLTLLCKNSPASLSRGMNFTFSGLVSIFFLCGWGGEISFQMLSDKCHIICRFIICNIERWGKNFNKLIFFPFFFKHGFIIIYSKKKNNPFSDYIFLVTRTMFFFRIFFYNFNKM